MCQLDLVNTKLILCQDFISAAGALLRSPESTGSMNHDIPLMTDLDAFFQNEQPPGFEIVQNLELSELGHDIYDDGPFSLCQEPIPSPSSGTITLPTNSPSLQEPWPDGNSVESSAPGITRPTTTTPAYRRHGTASKQVGQRLAFPQARHDDSWPQRSFRPSSKRPISQTDRLKQNNMEKLSDKRSRRGRPSQRPSCARCKIQKRKVSYYPRRVGKSLQTQSAMVTLRLASLVTNHLCIESSAFPQISKGRELFFIVSHQVFQKDSVLRYCRLVPNTDPIFTR